MRQQGLTRYDVNSLRPISRTENPNTMVFPRISIPGDPYLHDLSVMNQRSAALSPIHSPHLQPPISVAPAAPPAVIPESHGQVHRGLLAHPEPEDDWSDILHHIPEIGISRFLYILKKYPAIIMIIIGAWTLWGKGWATDALKDVEKNMGITAIIGGASAAAGVVFTSQHHSNDKNNAKNQTITRMIISAINVILSITIVVFGTVTISNIHGEDENPNVLANTFTLNERTANAGTMIGFGLLTGIFALMSLLFGWQGLSKVRSEEKKVKDVKRRRQAAYNNPGMLMDTY
ncbi:hypothetical protein FO519_006203 [Halicephalobus sp. NKZ332]|nr:hypothetical protein FO519_006203 [Halicephalobus sp. NKZ332]